MGASILPVFMSRVSRSRTKMSPRLLRSPRVTVLRCLGVTTTRVRPSGPMAMPETPKGLASTPVPLRVVNRP